MPTDRSVIVYTDYKSPYAYLANAEIWRLEEEGLAHVEWRPYILDIPQYLGSATVDDGGRVIEESRNPHQWRRVKYSYMDCRRQARKQGLVIRGTQKIWDSATAAAGMLFAQQEGADVFRRYNNLVFERFWRRALDIEATNEIAKILREAGVQSPTFPDWVDKGREDVRRISKEAEANGIFGVPSFVVDGELFWGREHLPDIRSILRGNGQHQRV
jgi:2-hydroxychromene-2-carboxylate isomerase